MSDLDYPSSSRAFPRQATFALVVLVCCITLPSRSIPAFGALADSGQWSPPKDWRSAVNGYAVHMALLPGDGSPYHSRVLWYTGESNNYLSGGQWGWKAGPADCESYPEQSFTFISVPLSGMDLFCNGHSGLQDGRHFMPGGSSAVTGSYGENQSRVFTSGSGTGQGSWATPDEMVEWRWYPTATTLKTGKAMVLGGSRHPHHRIFGGLRDLAAPASPKGDSLQRFAPLDGGQWDSPVLPTAHLGLRPSVREGHSFLETASLAFTDSAGLRAQTLFGGRESLDGDPLNDTWFLVREDNTLGTDYVYRWYKPNLSGTAPEERSEHTAVAIPAYAQMVVFGGRDVNENPRSDIHRLVKSGPNYQWSALEPSGTPPSARMGHIAIYNELTDTTGVLRRRMIVYGGTSGLDQSPADGNLHELRFSAANSATWSTMTVVDLGDGVPSARFWHAAAADPTRRFHSSGDSGHVVYVFGGALSDTATASYSGDLWELWLFENGRAGWQKRTESGTTPGTRGRHSLTLDLAQGRGGRLYVYGGRTSSGAADKGVYVFDPRKSSPTWSKWADAPFTLEGHTTVIEASVTLARIPEVYDPVADGWTALTGASLYRTHTYPLNFVVPRGSVSDTSRVVSVGQDPQTYWLDVPPTGNASQGWQTLSGFSTGFFAQTGVSYRPGKIMVAGGKTGAGAVGTTKTVNADSLSVGWVDRQAMAARYFHNLVLLPTGDVMAVGGVPTTDQGDVSSAVLRPQIWNPGTMQWTALDDLAAQGKPRNYHSTALLLPDGRVLSAGGEGADHKFFGEVYCPPYLFKEGTSDTALRPVIDSTVTSVTWGDEFTLCADTTGITRVALVRPGATTHAFDQNQRYVPLGFVKRGNPERLLVRTPASADSAPPGYYMLFLTGSGDGPDVPSFARWVQLRPAPAGRDTCDNVVPIARKLYVDLVSSSLVGVTWEAPADDDSIAFSGRVASYDIRRNWGPITEANWGSSTQATGEPAPLAPGEWQTAQVSGLASCTVYYFAMKSTDDDLQLSALGDTTSGRTACWGGGGLAVRREPAGNASADRVVGEAALGRDAAATSLRPVGGTIVAERRQVSENRSEVHLSRVSEVAGLSGEDPGVILQNADGNGGWKTTGRFDPGLDDEIAIAALRGGSRVVFLGNWLLGDVAGSGMGAAGPVTLTQALHSREGDVTSTIAEGGVDLLANDALTLTYESAQASGAEQGWFVTVTRGGTGSTSRRGPGAEALPVAFALHQNEPNPFDAVTTIRFDLPRAAHVKLEVFDLLGRRVATLADATYSAGFHAVPWNHRAGDRRVSPGMYVYRIVAGEQRAERKMMLVP